MTFDDLFAEHNLTADERAALVAHLAFVRSAATVRALTTLPHPQVPLLECARLIDECRSALAEELAGWDLDPPLHHVKQAHDRCVAWLAAHR